MRRIFNQQGKPLNEQEQLLAAIEQLIAALKGTSTADRGDTSSPAPALEAQQSTFQYKTRTINGRGSFTDFVVGNFFYLVSNTNANQATSFQVSFNNQATNACPIGLEFDTNYTQINFINNDVNPATIVYFTGNGKVNYHSSVITGSIVVSPAQAASGTYAGLVTTGAVAKIFTASTACFAIYLQADIANTAPIFIGFDNGTTAGKYVICLEPGDIYVFNNYNGNLYAYSAGPQNLAVSYA